MKHQVGLALVALVALFGLGGCASPVPAEAPAAPVDTGALWHAVPLPGKTETVYTTATKDGRLAICANSQRSASLWRRKLNVPADQLREVSFSWWVPELLPDANVAVGAREDAVVRVVFAFGGDLQKLPMRTRLMFDLAEAMTGELPPYATLMYVWDNNSPVGSVVVNHRSDRVRKIVLDHGPEGLRQWRDHRRDIVADFRRAYGEDPGPLQAIAVMTDTDNTGGRAEAWYGPIVLH